MEHTNREIFAGFLNRIVVIGKTCIRSEITTRNLVFFSTCQFFHPLTTHSIVQETIWLYKKAKIFVMIPAIFFASNDFVSDSVVTVQEQSYKMN